MKPLTYLALVSPLALAVMGRSPEVAQWPRFRGPNGTGIAAQANPPLKWDDTTNIKWKTALPGPGSSSPIVWGDHVFVTCYSGYGVDRPETAEKSALRRHVLCVDRSTGKILWDRAVPGVPEEDTSTGNLMEHGYASNTPATDGKRVYAFLSKSGVYAFDMDGNEVWHVDVGRESDRMRWGSSGSVVLYKNLVIVNAAYESRSLLALEAETGKEVWRVQSDRLTASYGTPVLVEAPGGRTELLLAVPENLWSFDPETGKNLWYCGTGLAANIVPSVTVGEGLAFVYGGFPGTSSVAVKLGGSGNVTETHVAWRGESGSYVPTPVYVDGRLHWVDDNGFAVCADAKTGKNLYRERLVTPGRGKAVYASVVLAGDRLYAMSRTEGTFVLPAAPRFEVLANNRIASDTSRFQGTPAVVGDQIILRSDKYLYCIEESK